MIAGITIASISVLGFLWVFGNLCIDVKYLKETNSTLHGCLNEIDKRLHEVETRSQLPF